MKASAVFGFIVLGVAAIAAMPAHAGLISDTFTTGDGTGTVGGVVNGQLTESGGATWSGRDTWEYSASNTLVVDDLGSLTGPNTRILSVPISIPTGTPVSVAADIIPPTTGIGDDWSAIGFSNSSGSSFDSGFFTPSVGQLWLALRKNGGYFVIAGSGTILVNTSPAPSYNATGFNHLELALDTATNLVTASINGMPVLSSFDLDTIPFTPNINEAGIHFHRTALAQADNFMVNVIPEPGSGILMCLASGLMALGRGRRRA